MILSVSNHSYGVLAGPVFSMATGASENATVLHMMAFKGKDVVRGSSGDASYEGYLKLSGVARHAVIGFTPESLYYGPKCRACLKSTGQSGQRKTTIDLVLVAVLEPYI